MTLPLDKQVVSLPIAKKLKELGVKQESLFHYTGYFSVEEYMPDGYKSLEMVSTWDSRLVYSLAAAYTVAELGEMLPAGMQSNRIEQPTQTPYVKKNEWHCWAVNFKPSFFADTEADARGKMLIYLLENKIVDPKSL